MKAFIFDMDGVIIDSEPIHFEVDSMVMRYYGIEVSQAELDEYVGMANEDIWHLVKEKHNLKQSVSEIIEYQSKKKIKAFKEAKIGPIEGIMSLLNKLQESNIPMAIASSSPRELIEVVINKFKIAHYFSYIISGEEVNRSKPEPDIYLETAQIMKVDPKDCVVLEDSRNGVISAKAAGMKCIGYYNPNSGEQDLSKADIIVESMKEVINYCKEF